MARSDLRTRAKKLAKEADQNFWILGELLAEIKTKASHVGWGYEQYGDYCERDLEISKSRASRLSRVLEVFGDYRESHGLDEVGWTCLAEALPIANKVGVDEAMKLAKLGLEEIRRWKAARRVQQSQLNLGLDDQQDWIKIPSVRMPPSAYRDWLTTCNLLHVRLGREGVKVDPNNQWQILEAMAQAAQWDAVAQLNESDIEAVHAGHSPATILTGEIPTDDDEAAEDGDGDLSAEGSEAPLPVHPSGSAAP